MWVEIEVLTAVVRGRQYLLQPVVPYEGEEEEEHHCVVTLHWAHSVKVILADKLLAFFFFLHRL